MDVRNIMPIDQLPEGKLVNSRQLNRVIERLNQSQTPMHTGQVYDVPRQLGITFAVKLEESGDGDNGSSTSRATYTYTVKDLDGNVLGDTDDAPVSPKAPRTVGALVGPATRGLACWDENGDLSLELAYEEYDTGLCDTPA